MPRQGQGAMVALRPLASAGAAAIASTMGNGGDATDVALMLALIVEADDG